MKKRCLLLFAFLCVSASLFAQVAPQMTPVFNKRKSLTSIRILDTIRTDTRPIIVNSRIGIPEVINTYPPNNLNKSMMTPTAWGHEGGGVVFAGIGGTFPSIYTARPDLIAVGGLAVGNPYKTIGVIGMINMNNVHQLKTFSTNLILNRRLSDQDAVAVGGIHMLSSDRTDASASYYVVYSHAVQTVLYNDQDFSRLSYSIGAGTGRFYTKSPADSATKKGIHGTAVFANVSYGLTSWLNVNVEWSGLNLHSSISVRPVPGFPAINLGLADLTRNSGDRIRFIASIHYAYQLWE